MVGDLIKPKYVYLGSSEMMEGGKGRIENKGKRERRKK